MKRTFDTLRETLDEFAQQDEFSLLALGCHGECVAYPLNFLKALDQTLPGHLVVGFQHPFHEPRQWLDAMLEGVRLQLSAAEAERTLPSMPMELEDGRTPPAQRLHALVHYLVALLPNQDDNRIVIAFLPVECSDVDSFTSLMCTLIPQGPEILPGITAARVIAWDDYERAGLRATLLEQRCAYALAYVEDFRTPALTSGLTRDASNTQLPLAERMASFTQLAALDYSYKRYDDALNKYAVLHQFHHERGQHELAAVALLGAGDTLFAAGDPVNAKMRLQQGIATAMACKALPALSNLLSSVTDVSMALGHYADAESYADSGTKVAAAILNPFVCADMLEKRGDAEFAQGRPEDAIASYTRCRDLCRTYGHYHRWYSALEKQAAIYAQANMECERRELQQEYTEAQALERAGHSGGDQA